MRRFKPNVLTFNADGTIAITLTRGHLAVIDADDYPLVRSRRWYAHRAVSGGIYAKSVVGQSDIGMHNLILPSPDGRFVDHRDGDGLNNRRSNLRLATAAQNGQNCRQRAGTSVYKGVCWHKRIGKWFAQIQAEGRTHSIGYFSDELEAAKAYDAAAVRLHGEFARINFPECQSLQISGASL